MIRRSPGSCSRQPFPQRPDDGDPSADARLEPDVDAGGLDGLDDLRAALRKKGLVRRHHRFSVADRLEQEVFRGRPCRRRVRRGCVRRGPVRPACRPDEDALRQADAADPSTASWSATRTSRIGIPTRLRRSSAFSRSSLTVPVPTVPKPTTPTPISRGETVIFALTFGGDWSIPFTPRIAWRILCSFSTSANRTNLPRVPRSRSRETATLAFVRRSFENSTEPIARNGSGMGAHTNSVPFGFSNSHPMRANPSTRQSLRFR